MSAMVEALALALNCSMCSNARSPRACRCSAFDSNWETANVRPTTSPSSNRKPFSVARSSSITGAMAAATTGLPIAAASNR
jgi:hypothetical protein